ncbi:DNA polymerase II [Colwellia sp. MEBiC06753]
MNQVCASGFVLTRKTFDTAKGLVISYWVITAQGPVNVEINDEFAIFFIAENTVDKAKLLLAGKECAPSKITLLPLKTFEQQSVAGVYFQKLRDFYQAKELLKTNGIKCFEDDIRPEDRFLMERFITDALTFSGTNQYSQHAFARITQAKCRQAQQDVQLQNVKLKMVSLDIECSPRGELYSIGLYADNCQLVMMIADNPDPKSGYEYIQWYSNEKSLLKAFVAWVHQYDPDIFIGWNVINFDFNLLHKRCKLLNIEFAIGRDNREPRWREQQSSEQRFIEIAGRVVIDGIDMLKTATYNFPSFSLDNVAHELLGKRKKVVDVDNRLQEIIDNFNYNKHALAAYNLEDCRLVWQIFEHTKLLEFATLRTRLTGLTIDRIGGSVAAFTNLYLPKLHRAGYIAPNLGDGYSDLVSPGGFVMDSSPGLYRNVLVLDFKSLYPSIIRTFFIDPMGLIEGLKAPEQAVEGFDGALFSRQQHFLPAIIDELWLERDKAKQQKNAALSQAIKIIMNSFYGILGSTGCRFFDPRLSGSITKRGHQLLKLTKNWIEAKGYQVIYGDTDSIFVAIGDEHTSEAANNIGNTLADYINQALSEFLQAQYQVTSKLELEFETHFSRFFMPTIRGMADVGTKKRYAGLVSDGENERIVYKGLETVRTDWTQLAKDFQQTLYDKVFHDQPVNEFILDTVHQTRAGQLDEKLVYRKRIRRKLADYQKNIPPHIKAARAADEINQQNGKPLKYQNKGWIEYVITTSGPQVVEHQSAPLDYQLYIERQLKAVADAILPFINLSFDQIVDDQLDLFQ